MNRKEKNEKNSKLAEIFAERRSHVYPAHEWLAEKFPEYVQIILITLVTS